VYRFAKLKATASRQRVEGDDMLLRCRDAMERSLVIVGAHTTTPSPKR